MYSFLDQVYHIHQDESNLAQARTNVPSWPGLPQSLSTPQGLIADSLIHPQYHQSAAPGWRQSERRSQSYTAAPTRSPTGPCFGRAPGQSLSQSAHLGYFGIRDLLGPEKAVRLGGARFGRDAVQVAVSQQSLRQRRKRDTTDPFLLQNA